MVKNIELDFSLSLSLSLSLQIWVTAIKQGLKTAVFSWPGAEINYRGMYMDVPCMYMCEEFYLHMPLIFSIILRYSANHFTIPISGKSVSNQISHCYITDQRHQTEMSYVSIVLIYVW